VGAKWVVVDGTSGTTSAVLTGDDRALVLKLLPLPTVDQITLAVPNAGEQRVTSLEEVPSGNLTIRGVRLQADDDDRTAINAVLDQLAACGELTNIFVTGSGDIGDLPRRIAALSTITLLELDGFEGTEAALAPISQLSELGHIQIANTATPNAYLKAVPREQRMRLLRLTNCNNVDPALLAEIVAHNQSLGLHISNEGEGGLTDEQFEVLSKTNLHGLGVRSDQLTDAIWPMFSHMHDVHSVHIECPTLSGAKPEVVRQLTQAVGIGIPLSREALDVLPTLPNLTKIYLLNSQNVDDSWLPPLGQLTGAIYIDLTNTGVTPQGVKALHAKIPQAKIDYSDEERRITIKPAGDGDMAAATSIRTVNSTISPADGWVDVKTLIDVKRDADGDGGAIDAGDVRIGHRSTLRLPLVVDGDYQLRASFTTPDGAKYLQLHCPIGDVRPTLVLSEWDNQDGFKGAGISTIDGKGAIDASNPTHISELIINNQKQQLEVAVSQSDANVTIKASIDEKSIVDWTGPAASLPGQPTDSKDANRVILWIYKGNLQLHSLDVKLTTGTATLSGAVATEQGSHFD